MDERAESHALTDDGNNEPGLFDGSTIKNKKAKDDSEVSSPDDINVEEPEGQELALDSDVAASEVFAHPVEADTEPEGSSGLPMDSIAMANPIQASDSHLKIHSTNRATTGEIEKLKERIEQLRAEATSGKPMHESDYTE